LTVYYQPQNDISDAEANYAFMVEKNKKYKIKPSWTWHYSYILWKEGTLILINTIGILPFPSYTILMNRMDYLLEILKKENLSIITKEQIDQYRILSPNFFQPNIHLYNEK